MSIHTLDTNQIWKNKFGKNNMSKTIQVMETYVKKYAESNGHILILGRIIIFIIKSKTWTLCQPMMWPINQSINHLDKIEKIKAVRLESGPKKSQGLSLNRSQIYSALRTYNTPTESQVVYK